MAFVSDRDIEQSTIVKLSGEVSNSGRDRVVDVLSTLIDSGRVSPRVDLADVRVIDSAGLLAVVRWCDQFRERHGSPEVAFINPIVRRIFEIAGRTDIIHGSVECEMPLVRPRQPVTDCFASAGEWSVCSFSVVGKLESCKVVRDRIDEMAQKMPFTAEELGDIKLAVGEAITNAIRHGCRQDEDVVVVRAVASGNKLVVEISDNGDGFIPPESGETDDDGLPEGGMGIKCMRKSMDEVSFRFDAGTTVTLVKRVKPK